MKSYKHPPPHPTQAIDYVPLRPDWIIDQDWEAYSSEDHQTWALLYEHMLSKLPHKSTKMFQLGIERIQLDPNHIANFTELSEKLKPYTGFEIVAVSGLVPDIIFFEHLANRRFPAGRDIRKKNGLDFQEYPDVFHDIFGHVALLSFKEIADFVQACGSAAVAAHKRGLLEYVARLYWFVIEVGLLREDGQIVSIGAAINSSEKELNFSLNSNSPNRIEFDPQRMMKTDFWIYDLQHTYFVLDDIKYLHECLTTNLDDILDSLSNEPTIPLGKVLMSDEVIFEGDGSYHSQFYSNEV